MLWSIDVPRGGTYEVWLEWACDDGTAGNPFLIQVGTQKLAGKVPGTGTWDSYRRAKFGQLELEPGNYRFAKLTIPLPLEVGKESRTTTDKGLRVVRAEKEETLTVPAGTFRCVVFVLEENGSLLETYWFAPGAGIVQMKTVGPEADVIVKVRHKEESALPCWPMRFYIGSTRPFT